MDGFLLIDKPLDWTSFDVVAKVRSVIKSETGTKLKVGHAGTLDPKASGLLIILIGSYTKRAEDFSKLKKTYRGVITLGTTSTTGDEEGVKKHTSNKRLSSIKLESTLDEFKGEQQQTPHKYSAVKINGQRAYKLAREAKPTKLKPRTVHIFDLNLISYDYPLVEFTTKVSSGTYIRSLAEDVGKELGSDAYLSQLRRLEVDSYNIDDAIKPENLNLDQIVKNLKTV